MIVKSILDTDLYKFTTSYAYMKLFPHAIGTFEFFDRDNTEYTEEFVQQLWIEISNFCSLKLTHDEQDYMTTHCRFIPPMYWEWLSGIRLTMAKETFDNIPGVVVDGIEYRIANGEPLPTYKTIEAIKEIYGEFIIVTSAETYKEIPRWQHGEEILKDNKFLVVDVAHFNSEDIPHDEVKVIYAPDITICSTAIRKWVDDGRIILPFVTDEVNSIIRKLGLYK